MGELVEKSLSGLCWSLSDVDERLVAKISQSFSVSDIVARVMVARGIDPDSAADFIAPRIKSLLPDPYVMKDMEKAARRVADAVLAGEGIGIFGDYDVDGATASAIMHRFLGMAGAAEVFVHIPDRKAEGYGLNIEGLRELHAKGARLAIALDCGITGFSPVSAAALLPLDVVIADHHESEVSIPAAIAVVDAKRIDDGSGLDCLAACGVSFLLCVAANRLLREAGHYKDRAEPDLFSLLDLVAFGTICDVVPLVGINRAFVSAGLKVLARRKNPGLKALCDISGLEGRPTSFHLGYVLGPRINAGGRVGDADAGEKLLSTDDRLEAVRLAQILENFNSERRAIENAVVMAAEAGVDAAAAAEDGFVFISGRDWHTGVIGIIAGRIKEKYRLPALVATIDGSGLANGSGRSVAGIDIGAAIIRAKEEGLLIEGGGHSMAAGFTLKEENIPRFKDFLREFVRKYRGRVSSCLGIDALIDIAGIQGPLMKSLEVLEPFGAGNEEPRFAIMNARLASADAIGGGNIRAYFSGDNKGSVQAILYRGADTELGEALLAGRDKRFRLAGKLRENFWQNRRTIQLVLEDAAPL